MNSNSTRTSTPPPGRPFPESDSDSLSLLSEERGPRLSNNTSYTSTVGTPDHELDGSSDEDPIVVCGFAVRFPGDASSSEGFWRMMMEKKCATGEFPRERVNIDGFHSKDYSSSNTLPLRGAHFIKEDTARFDADFFSVPPNEAASLDPMQRWLLEVAYLAVENAGIPMESIAGTPTGVFAGAFGIDYLIQLCRDAENPPSYAALGLGISMLANRLSWFFDLRGPSVGMDSACSSTAMALDHACDSLKKGSCNMTFTYTSHALLAGSNLAVAPETYTWLSNINFLSPSSRCYSFDHRANGYARGEGIGVVVLKRLSDAIHDGNTIRAVIRATHSNEDGRTPSITQPSREAQEALIQETYSRAGLSMAHTRFFESHGTGTAVGDPKEAQAIGTTFRKYRTSSEPLYVGALKSNIGHLEGCAALAGLVKAVIALEKGVIPPNTNFEKVNPKIDEKFLKIAFPQQPIPWPTAGLRRASVNSFGYGGSNSHIVLDDAYNYMRLRGLQGRHATVTTPPSSADLELPPSGLMASSEDTSLICEGYIPKLIVLTATDKAGIGRLAESLESWQATREEVPLNDLAYTLDSHRSRLPWASFCLVTSLNGLGSLSQQMSAPIKEPSEPLRIGFVFSGQGAQWFAMGRELLGYRTFKTEIEQSGVYLKTLGCSWLVLDEIMKSQNESRVDEAEFSQALCTVIQVALVNLLRRFDVRPEAVAGHSSGEIAAAYAAGYLDQESAWKVAYFRGICSSKLVDSAAKAGAMISVGLAEEAARETIEPLQAEAESFGISVACINSPQNVTVSGEEHLIDKLKVKLDQEKVFARKLRVPLAYHSGQMEAIASEYAMLLGSLDADVENGTSIPMLSSVAGARLPPDRFVDPNYWVQNMISPVRFSQAVMEMCTPAPAQLSKKLDMSHLNLPVVDHILEIGPHAALQGPVRDILAVCPERTKRPAVTYSAALKRGQHAAQTLLSALGALHCRGVPVDLRALNEPEADGAYVPARNLLVDLPAYPFDHSRRYWHESRLGRNYALRSEHPSEFVGVTSRESKWQWRQFLRRAESSWIDHHVVSGRVVYPAAGMMVMAIEAAKQVVRRTPEVTATGYILSDVVFENAIDLTTNDQTEVQTSLKTLRTTESLEVFEFVVETFDSDDEPRTNCRGNIRVEVSPTSGSCGPWERILASEERQRIASDAFERFSSCREPVKNRQMYDFLEHVGYGYGPSFQRVTEQRCGQQPTQARGTLIELLSQDQTCVVHPAALDSVIQLCFTALSSGGTRPMALGIPSRLASLWISALPPTDDESTGVSQAFVDLAKSSPRSHHYNGAAVQGGNTNRLQLCYEDLEFTDITTAVDPKSMRDAELASQAQFCMKLSTKVAIDKLTSHEKVDFLMSLHPDSEDVSQLHRDLEILSILSLEDMLLNVKPEALKNGEDWVKRYWSWAEYHLSRFRHEPGWDDAQSEFDIARRQLPQLCERLSKRKGISEAYAAVSQNLRQMIQGEIAPLELLMPSGLLDGFYAEGNTYRSPKLASAYISLLAHQKPGMRMLEVGGGTASTTKILIPQLSDGGRGPGALRCAQYDFTDISSGFLESARNYFVEFQPKMTFGTLNIENDPAAQGYEEGVYDIVLADNVLHATLDLVQTMKNVRKLLKPGGKVFMHEWFRADGWSTGFIFGLLAGWWLGADTGREMSPNVSVEDWDKILREAGFTGVDEVLRDFDEDGSYDQAYIVTTACDAVHSPQPPANQSGITFLSPNGLSNAQRALFDASTSQLELNCGTVEIVQSLGTQRKREGLVVYLEDYGSSGSILNHMSGESWKSMQDLFNGSRRILWVSSGGGHVPRPDHGMIAGLARTLRMEHYDIQLVTLALEEPHAGDYSSAARHLTQVARELSVLQPYEKYEQDYVEVNGRLHSTRLIEAGAVAVELNKNLSATEVIQRALGQSGFRLSDESGEVRYVEAEESTDNVQADEIIIEVETASIRSFEAAEALGWTTAQDTCSPIFADYCVGTVIAAGPTMDDEMGPNTRVLALWRGPFASRIRVSRQNAVALASSITSATLCALASSRALAFHVVRELLKPEVNSSVLLHDMMTPNGKAIMSLLDRKSVWGTVTTQEDADQARLQFNLPKERIIPKSWFESSVPLASKWKRSFDLILDARLYSYGAPVSLSGLRPGGRYVTIHPPELRGTAGQVLQHAPENVQTISIRQDTIPISRLALGYAAQHVENSGEASSECPAADVGSVKKFQSSELAMAAAHVRSMGETDTAILELRRSDIIDVQTLVDHSGLLRDDVTYVIVGLGGVGRGIARWMVQRGARHLLLLSRSGTSKHESHLLVSELSREGVQAEAPRCDVTSRHMLREVLDQYASSMPPFAGCVQTSMLMTEKMFSQMTLDDWNATIAPKTHGSWNLHTELPNGLDFFVLLSSVMGILGSGSLSAYNAGNTYQDALARYRVSKGERAICLDLGAILDVGYLSDALEQGQQVVALGSRMFVRGGLRDILGMLDIYCDVRSPYYKDVKGDDAQVVVGLRPPGQWKHLEDVPFTMAQPFWGHMHHVSRIANAEADGNSSSTKNKRLNVSERLAKARSSTEAAEVVSAALSARIGELLVMAEEGIEMQFPMESYGLDSLSAIHIRNWIGTVFDVDMPVFEILGGTTFTQAGASIARQVLEKRAS